MERTRAALCPSAPGQLKASRPPKSEATWVCLSSIPPQTPHPLRQNPAKPPLCASSRTNSWWVLTPARVHTVMLQGCVPPPGCLRPQRSTWCIPPCGCTWACRGGGDPRGEHGVVRVLTALRALP